MNFTVDHAGPMTRNVADNALLLEIIAEQLRRKHGYGLLARAMNRIPLIRRAYDEALTRVELLLLPTAPTTAPRLPRPDAALEELIAAAFGPVTNLSMFNHTHHPSMSLPCGTRAGLPVGMLLVGRHFDEATLYRAAYTFEQNR